MKFGYYFLIVFLTGLISVPDGQSAQKKGKTHVRCKMGILVEMEGKSKAAKQEEIVKPGTEIRLYVQPEADGFLYIIHSDQSASQLLSLKKEKTVSGTTVILPSPDSTFAIDGESEKEFFTMIFSPVKVSEIENLFSSGTCDAGIWKDQEQKLKNKSELRLSESSDKPFAIAGNVRGKKSDPFIDKLKIYSGTGMVVRQYVFKVKK